MTSRSKAVRAVITDRQQFMKHVTIVRQDAREQSVIKISHQISHSRPPLAHYIGVVHVLQLTRLS